MQFDIRFLNLTQGFTEFRNNRDTKIMYYLLINQEEKGSLKLSDLAYELTDMGGYDKPLEDFKRQYIKEYRENRQAEIDKLRAEHREKVKEERKQAKAEGRKYVPEKKQFPKVENPVNEVDGTDFNYEWIPLKEMLHPYASGDVDAGLRIYNQLDELGKKPENKVLRDLYTGHYVDLTVTLAKVEANGNQMDTDYTEDLAKRYEEEEQRLVEEMRKLPVVKQLEAEHQKLYERGLQEWAIPKSERDLEVAKLRDRYKNKLEFNPNSNDDKKRVLFELTGIQLPYNREYLVDSANDNNIPEEDINWSHYKTNVTVLEYIKEHYKEYADLAQLLLTHSLVKTRGNGFTHKLRAMVDKEGKLHGGLNSTGTGCVIGETLILTNEGIQEIRDLDDNRETDTFSDIDLKIHSHKYIEDVDGFYYSGKGEGKEIKLVDGTTLTTTNNHPIMKQTYLSQRTTFNKHNSLFQSRLKQVEWEEAQNILEGDYLALKIGTHLYGNKTKIKQKEKIMDHSPTSHTKHATLPQEMTKEFAEWLGMYMADGNISTSSGSFQVILTNSKEEVLQRFLYLTKQIFNLEGAVVRSKNRSPNARFSSVYVGRWLINVIGLPTGSHNKDVPKEVLQGTKEIQESFIKGLTLDTTVKKKKYPSVYFSSVSYRMMDKLRVMLLNMGIYASVRERDSYRESDAPTKEVVVVYDSAQLFLDRIGFNENDKTKILGDTLDKYKGKKGKRIGVIESADYVFVKVDKVEDTQGEFFDLHVPYNHSFIGEGVVNHNTSRLSSQNPEYIGVLKLGELTGTS